MSGPVLRLPGLRSAPTLVAFDVDGTLYDQRRLRRRVALAMLRDLAWSRSGRRAIRLIATFRDVREKLADAGAEDVTRLQYAAVAQRVGASDEEVRYVTDEWLIRRPLRLLADCRFPHVERVFAACPRHAIVTAVLADYPARDKLDALGLQRILRAAGSDPAAQLGASDLQ